MYDRFVLFTDHAALQWLLTIDDPSGRFIRWRLRLADLNIEAKYKKSKINDQADVFFQMHETEKAVPHDDYDDILLFDCDILRVKLGPNRNRGKVNFINTKLTAVYELNEAVENLAAPASTPSRSASKNYYKPNWTTPSVPIFASSATRGESVF